MVDIPALVDSGADTSYFGPAHAQFLGVHIPSGVKEKCEGTSGPTDCYYHKNITLEVGGHRLKLCAHFDESWNKPFAILGREGFFERFKVTIDESKKRVELAFHPSSTAKRRRH